MKNNTEEKTRVINNLDRCDGCGAQAWVLVRGVQGDLYFCSHHFNKHEIILRSWGYEIIDEREFLM